MGVTALSDILQVQGINSKGFGIIPKLVMQDKRLTTEAKAIYSYFCSYAGAGKTAFPSRSKIISDLGMSKSRFYKHFDLLKTHGYIKTVQENMRGRFQRNIYTLLEDVPCPQNEYTEPCPSLPCPQFACTQNEDSNNNSIKNNSFNNNSQSSQSTKADGRDTDGIAEKIQIYTDIIKTNIAYPDLMQSKPFDTKLIDEIVEIIIDALVSESEYVRIDGENKPRELVRRNLLSLDYDNVEHVTEQFKGVTSRISKKRQFILTMLYNSKMETDSHYTNLVTSDRT